MNDLTKIHLILRLRVLNILKCGWTSVDFFIKINNFSSKYYKFRHFLRDGSLFLVYTKPTSVVGKNERHIRNQYLQSRNPIYTRILLIQYRTVQCQYTNYHNQNGLKQNQNGLKYQYTYEQLVLLRYKHHENKYGMFEAIVAQLWLWLGTVPKTLHIIVNLTYPELLLHYPHWSPTRPVQSSPVLLARMNESKYFFNHGRLK